MRIHYAPDVDVVEFVLRDVEVAEVSMPTEDVVIELGEDGKPITIQLLNASTYMDVGGIGATEELAPHEAIALYRRMGLNL